MSAKSLIMYSRTIPCPDCERTRALLQSLDVPYQEVMIDLDPVARGVVENLTGFQSVPTLVSPAPARPCHFPRRARWRPAAPRAASTAAPSSASPI